MRQGAETSALQREADTETEQGRVSLARIPHLENSRCAICAETSATDRWRVDKHEGNRAEWEENKLLLFS
jgi:hypothetical protein